MFKLIKLDLQSKIKKVAMKKELINLKIDRKSFSVISLSDDPDDKVFWFGRQPIERLQYIEHLRSINYGQCATSRLQRIFEVAEI